jgi:broad specificity phosphatase PhoE
MTTLHLIRHATNDCVESGILAGRLPGVCLNEEGRTQAERIAKDPALTRVAAVLSSPLERAIETASPIAAALGVEVERIDELTELDFGDWAGRKYVELKDDPTWKQFNLYRSGCHAAAGESLVDAQYRMIRATERIRERFHDREVVAVSHGDPIRALLCWCLGMPLDLIQRIEVPPAARSTIVFGDWGPVLKSLCSNTLA